MNKEPGIKNGSGWSFSKKSKRIRYSYTSYELFSGNVPCDVISPVCTVVAIAG